MPELERELALLGREVGYPPTPRLAEAVAGVVPPGRGTSPRRVVVIAIAGALLVAGVAAAAVPSARDGVLELIGLRGATVERVPTAPTAPVVTELDLGRPSSLADAERSLTFPPVLPSRLGEPDGVFVRESAATDELSLVYQPRSGLPRSRFTGVGLLVGEFRGDLVPELLGKLVGPNTDVDHFMIDGRPAVWIAGAPHKVFYRHPGGLIRPGTVRLAANVLLLQRGRLLVRLEGAFGKQTAIAIARSLD